MTADTLAATSTAAATPRAYPDGWREVRLGEVFRFTKKPRELRLDGYKAIPFISMEYIPIGTPDFSAYQTREVHELTSGTYIEDGDLLVAKITPSFENGKQGIIEGLPLPFGYATTEVIPISDIPDVSDKHFLANYLLRSGVRAALAAKMEGSTGRQRLSTSTLANWEMMLPPLAEQRAIARVLRVAQEAIAARRREVTLERERKAALMQRLFTRGTRGEATQQTEIGEAPESWQVVKLGDVCDSSAYGPRFSGDLYHVDGNVATLRTTDISDDGAIDYSTMPLAKLDLDRFENHLLKEHDFLITRSGTCGIASVFEGFSKPVLPGAFLIRFRLANEKLSPYFLREYINSSHGRERISLLAVGAVQKNISGSAALMFSVPIPSVEEQIAIVDVAQRADAQIAALEREITLHDELFRALLEELMSGRLSALGLVEEAEVMSDHEGGA